ncbi:MAG: hypothetical protein RL553_1984 [Planctomycetota bacterium]
MAKKLFWIETLSSTHVGTGRGLGYIDLPLHREKVTNWPMIPGSTIKGVLADSFQAGTNGRKGNSDKIKAFGVADDVETGNSQAGGLLFSDARLLCLPVRSFSGTFAWCTSLLALQQFLRDSGCNLELPKTISKDGAHVCTSCSLGTPLGANNKTKVILEEYDLSLMPDPKVEEIANWIATKLFESNKEWQDIFKQRFAIVPEDLFNHFCLTGTEVVTRVRIDEETGVAADGQLWTEESLPVGTILTSSIECDKKIGDEKEQNRLLDLYANKETSVQMGGKASVGRGRVRCVFTNL